MTKLKQGSKAPAFKALNEKGETVSLSDYKGKKLVLYFYPQDNTPTCTVEACNLRDNYKRFQKEGYEILGVSPDSAKKHTNFIKKHELPFSLLVDEDLSIIKAYGVWGEKTTFGKTYDGVLRTTFVIDEKGIIEKIIDKVESKVHTTQIL
jgi:thioredoxin-dependent peroxiredoxin